MNLLIDKLALNNRVRNGYFSFLVGLITLILLPIHVHYLPPFMVLWCFAWLLENYSRFSYVFHCRKGFSLLFILFILTSQIKRAADSISLNIAEGSTGQSNAEQKKILGYAQRSVLEVVSCL